MEFTYTAYEKMVSKLRKNGYSFANYENCDYFAKTVILRHDIDDSIDKAVRLAELEYKLGVTSTWFVLLTGELYNIAAKNVKDKLLYIESMGHSIGLHFDELNYSAVENSRGGVLSRIREELSIMEQILDTKINAVSMHRPSQETLEANYDLSPIINSYGKKFFKEYKYVSDSRRRWRENVDEIIESGEYNKLHILTHAFWYNDEEETIETTIGNFISGGNRERYRIVKNNITDLDSIIRKEEL